MVGGIYHFKTDRLAVPSTIAPYSRRERISKLHNRMKHHLSNPPDVCESNLRRLGDRKHFCFRSLTWARKVSFLSNTTPKMYARALQVLQHHWDANKDQAVDYDGVKTARTLLFSEKLWRLFRPICSFCLSRLDVGALSLGDCRKKRKHAHYSSKVNMKRMEVSLKQVCLFSP